MVTEAGKELLRNTINTAKFHNRILEENEMWKQFDLERGLTMMVSDDLIMKRAKKHHQCSKHRRSSRERSKSIERVEKINSVANVPGPSKVVDRWDHSGFRELYPDEVDDEIYNSPSTSTDVKKWDHSGFLELYPEEALNEKKLVASSKSKELNKQKKKKRKHSKGSTSDTEIWEEFKMYKRKKTERRSKEKLEPNLPKTIAFDSQVKKRKKQRRNELKSSHM